jgi:hypothetical protein
MNPVTTENRATAIDNKTTVVKNNMMTAKKEAVHKVLGHHTADSKLCKKHIANQTPKIKEQYSQQSGTAFPNRSSLF